ncbi:hypothetical protein HMPREF2533_02144 [Bacteroides fragilis]|nr:hypothetical protein HMPREF2530_02144 [Bacteroides fragilis]KXU46174.1 hypothetical protein HMPREF2533_02144 [Bacteroides fragilis]
MIDLISNKVESAVPIGVICGESVPCQSVQPMVNSSCVNRYNLWCQCPASSIR